MKIVRSFLLGCCLLIGLSAQAAFAQDYPSRLIKMIVPFPAGSFSDVVARAASERASRLLGQPIIIENKVGVNGVLGTKAAIAADPDGYTILLNSNGHAANASLYKVQPYDPVNDFSHLSRTVGIPFVLMVRPGLEVNNVAELIALAKKKPNELTFGAGNSSSRAAAELFKMAAKVDIRHIPYRGMPQAITDLISGQVDIIITDTSYILSQGPTGPLRGLAVTTTERLKVLPNIPTFQEAGLQGVELIGFLAVFAPPKTPEPIVRKLNEVLVQVGNDPSFKEFVEKLGTYSSPTSPEELKKFIAAETDKWARIHEAGGIEKQ